uniref:Uncharacterized protein n=1 Tax=Cacopsylla melanoneura TaxID=428564 RepID=A0A8D8LZU1_9HEMI
MDTTTIVYASDDDAVSNTFSNKQSNDILNMAIADKICGIDSGGVSLTKAVFDHKLKFVYTDAEFRTRIARVPVDQTNMFPIFFFPLPIVDRPYGRRTNTTLVKCSRNRSSTEEDCIVHAVYDDSEKVLELNDENYTLQTTRKNVYQDCHSVFEKCIGRLKSIHRLEVTSSATTIMMKTYDRSFETLLLAFGTACPHMDVILH